MRKISFQRGEILLVDLEPTIGREQRGTDLPGFQ